VLATLRRPNCTDGFPVCSFHEDSEYRDAIARLGFVIPSTFSGPRGITPAFEYGAPHSSARGTLTLLSNVLLSTQYGLSDSRSKKTAGLPGSSTHLSSRAASNHPGESGGCFIRLLDHRCQASSAPTDWPLPYANEAELSSLALRLASSPCKAS
jgi:hypothetical protein